MQYTQVTFAFHFEAEYEQDLFYQGLADLGFESFDEDKAYIQTALLDEMCVREYAKQEGQTIVRIEQCPDDNWNATWEAEHPMVELPDGVRIVPHCAFGAGHHETTGMLVDHILQLRDAYAKIEENYIKDHPKEEKLPPFAEEVVLDNGCGTGVLGIYAAKYGAKVTAVDIDDKSVVNTVENAKLNGVTIDARLGNVPPEGEYSLILSNIHRNILLEQMPLYAKYLVPGGLLFLSGFYEADVKPLVAAAEAAGLQWEETDSRGEWFMLVFEKPNELHENHVHSLIVKMWMRLAAYVSAVLIVCFVIAFLIGKFISH